MSATEIFRKFSIELEKQNLEPPVCVEVGEKTAQSLNEELRMMLKYSTNQSSFRANECMYIGILIVAPRNFCFTREKPSLEDFQK